MKIIYLFTLLLIISSCKREDKISCTITVKNIKKCSLENDTNTLFYFFKSNLILIEIANKNSSCEIRIIQGKNKIHSLKYYNSYRVKNDEIEIKFNNLGEIYSTIGYNFDKSESIERKKNSDEIRYEVYYEIPHWKVYKILYYFSINNNGDTLPEYNYYRKYDNSYKIITDQEDLFPQYKKRDSMYIEYTNNPIEKVEFSKSENNNYVPNLSPFTVKKIYNTLTIPKKGNLPITGVLWGFNNDFNPTGPYSYRLLILNGDMLNRVKMFENQVNELEKKYSKGYIDSIQGLNEILKTMGISVKNGNTILSEDLKKAINKAR